MQRSCPVLCTLCLFVFFVPPIPACNSGATSRRLIANSSTKVDITTSSSSRTGMSSVKNGSNFAIAAPSSSLYFGHCGHSYYVNNGESPNGENANSAPSAMAASSKVVSGSAASQAEFPWQAYLSIYSEASGASYLCGGSLISSQWILTAAHCCAMASSIPERISIGLGGTNLLREFPIKTTAVQIAAHQSYNAATHDNDICLLKIEPPIDFNSWTVQPICLPQSCDTTCKTGEYATISGWGLTDQGIIASPLQRGYVPIIDPAVCLARYPTMTPNQLCAGYLEGGTDSCQGDSGGPLSCLKSGSFYLDGVTSFGSGCGKADSPGVYSRVCRYLGWIASVTSNS